MTPLSIIIPTLNSASTVGRAIESVRQQTVQEWELLIMDGVSADNTIDVIKKFDDKRIKIHIAKDRGIYDAMNHGIQEAVGEWLYFLGSDDYLLGSDVFEKMLCNTEGLDMIYGDADAPHLPPEHFGEWSYEALFYNRCHQATFYRRSIFNEIGFYPLKYPICADYYINLRVFLGRCHHQYRPVRVAFHSAGGASCTESDTLFYNDLDRLIVRYGLHSLPRHILKRHCENALKHHCTKPQRAMLTILQSWLRITS